MLRSVILPFYYNDFVTLQYFKSIFEKLPTVANPRVPYFLTFPAWLAIKNIQPYEVYSFQ